MSNIICKTRVDENNPWDRYCTRVEGHSGPHLNTPIPMGMTAREWEDFVETYR